MAESARRTVGSHNYLGGSTNTPNVQMDPEEKSLKAPFGDGQGLEGSVFAGLHPKNVLKSILSYGDVSKHCMMSETISDKTLFGLIVNTGQDPRAHTDLRIM